MNDRAATDPALPHRVDQVRWRFDPDRLPFETTREVTPTTEVVGQDSAVDALTFGLESRAPGQNVFVRGLVLLTLITTIGSGVTYCLRTRDILREVDA